ncbi:MAG: phosphotransferase [Chloroflexi bacterium]|nr:phosphotransferase [Chloroflexota bacterium]
MNLDPAQLAMWCRAQLGAEPVATLFETGHLSDVLGLRLSDRREVVVKVRPAAARLAACTAVQRHLWAAGFPCPEPLAGPAALGAWTATAEASMPGDSKLPATAEALPELSARSLRELVRMAPEAVAVGELDPTPPWFGFGQRQPGLWPELPEGDPHGNLSRPAGAWIDDAARLARARLDACRLDLVVGHCDWHGENLTWEGDRLLAVYDWDSVIRAPEAAIAGAAAVAFGETHEAPAATLEEGERFLEGYGRPWTDEEEVVAWAAGLWLLAFNAKSEAVRGIHDRTAPFLERELEERVRRAGA